MIVISAMRDAAGSRELTAREWLAFPDVQLCVGQISACKFGIYLKKHMGACGGEYELRGRYDKHRKVWLFRAWNQEQDDPVWRQRQFVLRQREEARAAYERASDVPPTPKFEVAPAPEPAKVEYETTTRVDSTGRIVSTPVVGRDGQPLKKHPTAPAAVPTPKPAEPAPVVGGLPPGVGRRPDGELVRKRQPTRAELAARHHQSETAAYRASGQDPFAYACEVMRQRRGSHDL